MITLGKKGGVAHRRLAASFLMTPEAVDKLFATIGPRFGDRNGGYTRIILTGFRKGDGGEKAFIEILGSEKVVDEKREKRAELRAKRAEETRKAMEESAGPGGRGRRRADRVVLIFGASFGSSDHGLRSREAKSAAPAAGILTIMRAFRCAFLLGFG